MKSIPVTIVESYDWLNAGLLFTEENTEGWNGFEYESGEVACQHHSQTSYYTDDLVSMYGICDDCGTRVSES